MNPLQRARQRAGSAWYRSREATKRTVGWVKDGVAGNADRLRGAFGRDREGAPAKNVDDGAAAREGGDEGLWERLGGASAWDRARTDRRVAIAWVAGTLLFVAWIAWIAYIWSENGSTAGIGVLISWPAVLAALALLAAPFVGAGVLVRRRRLAIAGAPAMEEGETDGPSGSDDAGDEEDEDPDDDSADEDEPGDDEGSADGDGPGGDDEDSADEDEPDEDSPDEDSPDEDSPDEDSPDEDSPDEDSPDEDSPDEDSPDEDESDNDEEPEAA